jgi:AcrR family transcriptional regulator
LPRPARVAYNYWNTDSSYLDYMEWTFQMSSPPASGEPRRRADAVRNRQRVLEATRTLLVDPGAHLTVEAIAAKAGVGAATVVRSFGSKEALIDVAVADLLEPVIRRARDGLSEESAQDALRRFLIELIAFQSGHWTISEQLKELDLPSTTAQRAALTKAVTELMNRARDEGAIRTDIDPGVTMVLIRDMTNAIARSPSASPQLAESYVLVLMDGLRPQQPRA